MKGEMKKMKYSFPIRPSFSWDGVKKKGTPAPCSLSLTINTNGRRRFSSVNDLRKALRGQSFPKWIILADDPWCRVEVEVKNLNYGQLWFLGEVGATLSPAEEAIFLTLDQIDQENLLEGFLGAYELEPIRPIGFDVRRSGEIEPRVYFKFDR